MGNIIQEKNYSAINIMIGANIQQLRELHKMTQFIFAKKIGMSRANLVNVENGIQSLPLKRIYDICEAFNFEIQKILPTTGWYSENKNKKIIKRVSIEIITQ